MKIKRQLISLIVVACLMAIATAAEAGMLGQGTDLNSDGLAYELNLDSQGLLWISDSVSGEIWKLDPDTGVYTIFPVGGGPTDARGDGTGHAWWTDFNTNQLGRLTVSDATVDIWAIPDSLGLYTTAIDADGDVWVTDFFDPKLYKLDPDQAQDNLCVYDLPDAGLGSYMTVSGQNLWLGDYNNGRILRVETDTDTFTWWQLRANSYPQGIAVDGAGMVWWADTQLDIVGRLNPDPVAPSYTAFDPPTTQIPQMLSLHGDQVWMNLQTTGAIAVLEPAAASGQDHSVTSSSQVVEPVCSTLAPTPQDALTTDSGTASWSDQDYPTAVDQDGWAILSSPADATPWGIVSASQVWTVDQGRSKLMRLPYPARVTVCKLRDADGDLATTGDQTPVANSQVYLRIAGVRQEPARLTGQDGCATWLGLGPGPAYGVEEVEQGAWLALTPTVHDFEASASDQSYSFTFINQQAMAIYLPMVAR